MGLTWQTFAGRRMGEAERQYAAHHAVHARQLAATLSGNSDVFSSTPMTQPQDMLTPPAIEAGPSGGSVQAGAGRMSHKKRPSVLGLDSLDVVVEGEVTPTGGRRKAGKRSGRAPARGKKVRDILQPDKAVLMVSRASRKHQPALMVPLHPSASRRRRCQISATPQLILQANSSLSRDRLTHCIAATATFRDTNEVTQPTPDNSRYRCSTSRPLSSISASLRQSQSRAPHPAPISQVWIQIRTIWAAPHWTPTAPTTRTHTNSRWTTS